MSLFLAVLLAQPLPLLPLPTPDAEVSVDATPVAKAAPAAPVVVLAAPPALPPVPAPPLAPAPPAARQWNLGVQLGAEQSFERYSDGILGAHASVALARTLPRFQLARLQVDARFSSQPYRNTQPTPGQPTPTSDFAEQRYSVTAEYGLDLAGHLFHSSRFSLTPFAAVSVQRWQNAAFPSNYLGLGGEVRARVGLTSDLSLSGGAGYSWNVLQRKGAPSAVGAPHSDTVFDVGLSLAVAGNHSVDLTWRGDLLALDSDYRLSNGLTVGFGSTF